MTNSPLQQIGRYQILSLLGRGGMADVYRAHDPQLDRDVAVKLIHPQFADEEGFAERFSREARAVARLRHPNIIQVFDFDLSDARPYMVMELADGQSLKDRLKSLRDSGTQMTLPEIVRVASAIAGAIDYAHAQGMTHRDIKPSNILFTANGEPLLADFGLAQISGQTVHTAVGSVSGTPAYMSPEQAQGKAEPASDLYSFAVVVYEMLAGRAPFAGSSATELILKQLQERPPAPQTWRADLNPAVDAVLQKALAKSPGDRYPTAAVFVTALDAAMHGKAASEPTPGVIADEVATLHDAPLPAAPVISAVEPRATEPKSIIEPEEKAQPAAPATPVSGLPPYRPASTGSSAAQPAVKPSSRLHRTVETLGSVAQVLAPLIGREKVPVSTKADDRRTALASLMAILGIFLAVLQFVSTALDLVTRTFAPLFQALPVVIAGLLALGAIIAIVLARRTASPQHRRYAMLVLGLIIVGAAGWGGWQLYDRTRPPAGPIVLIADFESCKGCDEITFGKRIYEKVKAETDRLHLPNVEVRHVLETFPDSATARARGADLKATLVIWGSYDKAGVLPHFELLRLPEALPRKLIQPESLSEPDFHLQNGDREVTFVTLVALGLTRYIDGDYASALSLYDQSIQELAGEPGKPLPNAEMAYYLKALTEYSTGRPWSDVIADLKQATVLKPAWADAHYLLGLAYIFGCNPDGSTTLDLALAESDAALRLQPSADNYWLRGNVLANRLRWIDAASAYAQSLKLKDDPSVRASLIDAYQRTGQAALAAGLKSKPAATPAAPVSTDVRALSQYASALVDSADYPHAIVAYQQAISRALELKRSPATLAGLYLGLASAQYYQGQYDAALQNYLASQASAGDNWVGYDSLGLTYQKLNRPTDAIAAYKQSLLNQPCDEGAHLSLGALYEQQKDPVSAVEAYRKAALANPARGVTQYTLATLLYSQGKFAEANAALAQAAQLLQEEMRQEPTDSNHAYLLGAADQELGDYAGAAAAYQQYVALEPADPSGYRWLGIVLTALARYPEAIAALEKAKQLSPVDGRVLAALGDAYAFAKRPTDALSAYQQATTADPKNPLGWEGLGRFYTQQQQWSEAIQSYEMLISLTPEDPSAHLSLSFAYGALGRTPDALKEARAAVALQPNNPGYQVNLALVLLDSNLNDEALAAAQKAVQLDATQVLAHYALGLAYKAKGDKTRAVAELQIVIQNPGAGSALHDRAAEAIQQMGG